MTETIDESRPIDKVYKEKAIWPIAFLGGPLAIGYLFSANFKALGQPEKARSAWIITIIGTVVIFAGLFLIPDSVNIPSYIIPIAYSSIALGLFKKYQEEKVNEHINAGGLVYGWWRVFAIGFVGLIITVGVVFSLVFGFSAIKEADVEVKTYGLDIKDQISFRKTNIAVHEVDEIAGGFTAVGFFNSSYEKNIFIEKTDDTYDFYISINKGMENDKEVLEYLVELRSQLDNYFPYKKIRLQIFNDYLDNVVKVLE